LVEHKDLISEFLDGIGFDGIDVLEIE